ncbi:MAG: trifunctional transcriptional regulator/proline dehydrogenase/L-glutamate gamma-semialdehyde dehydrogenase [Pseudomonadota bacterium]
MQNISSMPSEVSSLFIPFASLEAELVQKNSPKLSPLRSAITKAYRLEEPTAVKELLAHINDTHQPAIKSLARKLVTKVREKRARASGIDALMLEFSLSSEEGVALMCLAEALLRIPDSQTIDRLIADKIHKGNWKKHLGKSPSLFVNAASWGLLISGKIINLNNEEQSLRSALNKLISKGGEPLIRKSMDLAMRLLGNHFVTGQTIEEALHNSRDNEARGYRYSYDMLGEMALTEDDAAKYYAAYEKAIHAIGQASNGKGVKQGAGISIKLSALHPRYSRAQHGRVMKELLPRVRELFLLAKHYNIGLNIDAEEADRLELSLDLLEALVFDSRLTGFEGIGFVVQAYQKRCPSVIDFLIDLTRKASQQGGISKLMVRLVKGAYWDSEIKRAQVDGLSDYPVYTRKVYTDLSYLVCAQKLLAATDVIYPQFATHNAHTFATIYTWAQQHGVTEYEFQCLHGMGETLYDQIVGADKLNIPCRIYAPVGSHETLLAYLVRRLLENGANSSFVNQIVDPSIPIDTLIADPLEVARELNGLPHSKIPLPCDLFGAQRKNSSGVDLTNEAVLSELYGQLQHFNQHSWQAAPLLEAHHEPHSTSEAQPIINPADRRDQVGHVIEATNTDIERALSAAHSYTVKWQTIPPWDRAEILCRAAELLESHRSELIALAIREAGKSITNAIGEVREAVDFLRYYAMQACDTTNSMALGTVVCISPWNFPLAIFIGQISASLAAGNVVVAKPAEQTPLIAYRAVQLLHQAGIPFGALQLLPGRGEVVGAQLVADSRVKGVIFTGSTEVARLINRTLAERAINEGTEIAFIAETGGQNALIVDSTALPEQVVQDVIASAFDSAGQRCSALRVLCLQTDIADKTLTMLKGALQELSIGNPDHLAIDVGPVIDTEAQQHLVAHIQKMQAKAKGFFTIHLPAECELGTFVAPTVIEISSLSELTHEVFGPILHVLRYQRHELPQLIEAINASGYGLTLGVHSRIDETIDFIASRAHVGNIYINRNIVGAVVGVQPFGGEGKSGTGPKAGGPLYLKRLQRNTLVPAASYTRSKEQYSPALEALTQWAKLKAHERLLTLIEQYLRTTLLNASLVLPGPTGERNTLSFAPRGSIICIASNTDMLLNQLAAVFATGNNAVLLADSAHLLPEDLPPSLRDAVTWTHHPLEECLKCLNSQIALVATQYINEWRPQFATCTPAILSIIEMNNESTVIPLWRLVAERTLCVNTTAAGGNASLMSLTHV